MKNTHILKDPLTIENLNLLFNIQGLRIRVFWPDKHLYKIFREGLKNYISMDFAKLGGGPQAVGQVQTLK